MILPIGPWQTGSMQDHSRVSVLCVTVNTFKGWHNKSGNFIHKLSYAESTSQYDRFPMWDMFTCILQYNWLDSPCCLFLSETCGSSELVCFLGSDTDVSYQWTRRTTSLSFCCLDWYSIIISVEDNGYTAQCQDAFPGSAKSLNFVKWLSFTDCTISMTYMI